MLYSIICRECDCFAEKCSDSGPFETGTLVLGRSLVRSHRSLIRLFRTARFTRALHCANLFTRSLAPSGIFMCDCSSVLNHCEMLENQWASEPGCQPARDDSALSFQKDLTGEEARNKQIIACGLLSTKLAPDMEACLYFFYAPLIHILLSVRDVRIAMLGGDNQERFPGYDIEACRHQSQSAVVWTLF